MRLIVGLGNPGIEYQNTRHNIGFMALDHYAKENNISFSLNNKLKGEVAEVRKNGKKTILLKPTTYMNLSGESVIAVVNFYKINIEDIIVISDDLDSHLGRVRLRAKGSAGGHNGHKNIALHLKTEEYKRVKVGIDRSPLIPVIDWVLKKFNAEELVMLEPSFKTTDKIIDSFINGVDFYKISSLYSTK